MNDLWKNVMENGKFLLAAVGIAIVLFAIAYLAEKLSKKKNGDVTRILSTRKMAMIGLFSAIAGVLMTFEFPIALIAPSFYMLDFGDLPALIGGFAFGPVAGVMIEFIKVIVKLLLKGTSSAFVGDLANFVVGCSFILPASIIYSFKKTKKNAILACVTGTLIMIVFGTTLNAVYLIPTFSILFHLPVEQIIAMGTALNDNIDSLVTFVVFAVAPLNLIKGFANSLLTILIYKKISPILKSGVVHKKEAA